MVIGNLEPKLILHGNDNLHMVQAVQAQVLDEVRLRSELFIVNLVKEVEHQHHPEERCRQRAEDKVEPHLC